jgi:hypothetical protein
MTMKTFNSCENQSYAMNPLSYEIVEKIEENIIKQFELKSHQNRYKPIINLQ